MKIDIIGGGPAGLFFSILMKKRGPAHAIRVWERNPRDNTFGWGVVFSDKTMSYLQAADEAVHAAICARFRTWDNVDIVHRGEKISAHGNRFSGIARIALLHVLQARAAELGVEVHFETPIATAAAGECDLLVGADGYSSAVRESRREAFRPSFDARRNRYIWFGTPTLFHGLTLTFRESVDGLLIAHSYKFDGTMSTFIVECDPETFARARLGERSDADVRAYLQDVFKDDLRGAPLLSNASRWLQFAILRNERWYDGNVVLLGDALHTVHFSIGSGTKLALEDAIALADAFGRESTVGAALRRYELERRPIVEEVQSAAEESLAWFERAKDFLPLSPLEFAWSCMTRSKRVDRESLLKRDRAFVEAVEGAREHS